VRRNESPACERQCLKIGTDRTRCPDVGSYWPRGSGLRSWSKVGQQELELGFLRRSLAAHKSGREAICTLIAERAKQGGLSVERMCDLSGVSRAGFLPALEIVGTTPGRYGASRCHPAGDRGKAVLRIRRVQSELTAPILFEACLFTGLLRLVPGALVRSVMYSQMVSNSESIHRSSSVNKSSCSITVVR
jgi:hypothetical protein